MSCEPNPDPEIGWRWKGGILRVLESCKESNIGNWTMGSTLVVSFFRFKVYPSSYVQRIHSARSSTCMQ